MIYVPDRERQMFEYVIYELSCFDLDVILSVIQIFRASGSNETNSLFFVLFAMFLMFQS